MGTNYYVKTKKCPECGNKPEGIHLGKSSGGWQFTFQYNGGQYYKNVEQMKKWLKDKKIENEYGENVSYKKFWEMVDIKQKEEKFNHAESHPSDTDFVVEGYSFTNCYFN